MARLLPAVAVAVVALGLTLFLANLSFFAFLELKALDLLFTLRGPLPPPENIVIVAIDEPSMAQIGQQWPWPRSLHARLIRQLKQAGAKVIGLDILFSEPSEPAEDQALAQALRKTGNVVLVNTVSVIDDPLFRHIVQVDPLPVFRNAASVGSPLISLDADGVVRRPRVLESDPPSFARQVIRHYRESAPERSSLLMGTASDGSIDQLINYLGPARTVKTVSYYQAIDYEHLLPPGIFSGKIVLVGRSLEASPTPAPLSGDLFLTPFSWISGEPLAGIEIQAILIDNILEKRFIRELNKTSQWILLLVLTLASSLLIIKIQLIRALIVVSGLATLSIIISYWVFAKMGLWVPLFSAILSLVLVYGGHLLVRALRVEHERRRLLEAMNHSLETKVAERTKELSFAHQELSQQHQQLELAYRKLAQTQQQLVHSEKMASLGLLVAGVAHELNNPISYVNSNLDFIEDYTERLVQETGMPDGAINLTGNQFQKTLKTLRELIASCKGGTERVRKVVMDLQIFSRADDIDLVLADLHQGLESTLNLLARQYSDRITIHRDYGRLPLVECYPGQINQVFMNLLQNAVQAIPDSGDVWIKTSFDNGWVNILIKDNGIGIPEKNLNQIFDPFFTTKELGSGTGLGLSISYGIIRKHGGQIYITSVVHEGTEFTIQLPIRH